MFLCLVISHPGDAHAAGAKASAEAPKSVRTIREKTCFQILTRIFYFISDTFFNLKTM